MGFQGYGFHLYGLRGRLCLRHERQKRAVLPPPVVHSLLGSTIWAAAQTVLVLLEGEGGEELAGRAPDRLRGCRATRVLKLLLVQG